MYIVMKGECTCTGRMQLASLSLAISVSCYLLKWLFLEAIIDLVLSPDPTHKMEKGLGHVSSFLVSGCTSKKHVCQYIFVWSHHVNGKFSTNCLNVTFSHFVGGVWGKTTINLPLAIPLSVQMVMKKGCTWF